jgi:hypothetical protein
MVRATSNISTPDPGDRSSEVVRSFEAATDPERSPINNSVFANSAKRGKAVGKRSLRTQSTHPSSLVEAYISSCFAA